MDALSITTIFLALMTGALAIFTAKAAMATSRAAEAAVAEARNANTTAELARASLEAGVRPLLVDVPQGKAADEMPIEFDEGDTVYVDDPGRVLIAEDDRYFFCSVPLRNVGPGAAFIRGLGLRFGGDVGWSGKASATVVPSGEVSRFTFSVPKDRQELQEAIAQLQAGSVVLAARYTDVRGQQDTTTQAYVFWADGKPRVRQVSLHSATEREPIVMSGAADF